MKTSRVVICCLLAALTLRCESAHQVLNSINDLRSLPRHSVFLLYWFANSVSIDQYNRITVPFDPNTDYGSHYYSNFERILERPNGGYRYYTVGNRHTDVGNNLPGYVRNEGTNSGRIIFSALRENGRSYAVSQVYLTQHDGTNEYDPYHTYQISTNLLQQIRQLPSHTALWFRIHGQGLSYSTQQSGTSGSRGTYHFNEQSYSHDRGFNKICEMVCKALIVLALLMIFVGLSMLGQKK